MGTNLDQLEFAMDNGIMVLVAIIAIIMVIHFAIKALKGHFDGKNEIVISNKEPINNDWFWRLQIDLEEFNNSQVNEKVVKTYHEKW